jgi:hypothetical protein
MFKVRILQSIFGGTGFSADLETRVELPFPPTPAIGLGLYPCCDLYTDHLRLTNVMWLCDTNEFLAEADDLRFEHDKDARDSALWHLKEGWAPHLSCHIESRPLALHVLRDGYDGGEGYVLASVGSVWHILDANERWLLEQAGVPFQIEANP